MTTIGNASLNWLHVGLIGSNAGLGVLKLENIESKEVIFSNNQAGDGQGGIESYRGGWRDDQPEGEGRYTWPDGSIYEGSWMSGQKHGWGKYSWPSGATYLGEWKHGCLHGYGTFHSPDGSKYQGNWENNQKKGIGTKWCSNGDRYEGLYLQDQPHGPGRFLFASGDEFDGEFREGKFHGQGTFKWISKHRYDGEWWQGMKHGVGVFTWPDGATYEGFWQKGMQHGIGVFRPARHKSRNTTTTTTIDHTNNAIATANAAIVAAPAAAATAGAHMATVAFHHLSDSAALFRPSSHTFSGLTPLHPLPQPPHAASAAASPPESRPGSPSTPRSPAAASASTKAENFHSSTTATNTHINKDTAASTAVYACDYRLGDLILEEALQPEDLDYVFGTATRSRKYNTDGVRSGGGFIDGNGIQSGLTITIGDINYTTNTTAGGGGGGGGAAPGPGTWKWMAQQSLVPRRRRPKKEERMGEIIYKGSPSFDLMLNLQLGIRYTLTTLSKLPPLTGALEKAHFQEKVWLKFPRQGSEVTPPHPSNDFKWKDYNPIVFRQLRGLFGISNSEYILSTCGDHALREMPSPGKSGSVFFVSQDERFIIKTMRKEEVKLLLRTLPLYYAHVASHPDTLISRFYGIHRITLASGRKVRFVVMNNIFATEMPLHKIYDLKGSTYKRTALGASLAPRSPSKAPKEQADSSSSSSGANLNPASSIIFKDLDLKSAFQLKKPVAERLQRQLAADAEFLQSADVMDYSLLLGVHFRNKKDTTRNKNLNSGGGGGGGDGGGGGGGGGDYNNMRLAHRQKPEQQQLEGPNSATISNETRRTTSSIAVPGPSYPEESENEDEVVTPGSSIHSPSESSTSTQKTPNPILLTTTTTGSDGIATANGVNMTGEVNGDDVSPLVIHNSMSFSAKVSKTHLRQQQQLPPLPAPPAKLPKFGTGLYISRFISWRRDTKEKRRQKAEQATGGLGKVAPPPTPAPPLPLDPLQQDLFSLVAPCSPSLSSSSGTPVAMAAVDAPFTTFHRRATSATAALGSVNSNSLFSSPAAFHVGMAGSSSTAPSSPMVDVQQRPASGPIFRTASAVRDGRTAATATKNNKNSKTSNHAQQQHLKVTYSDQLMEQHAALVASLANWEIRNNVTARPPSAALPHAATRHGEQQQQQNNVEDLKTPSKQPTASHQTTLSKPSNDENTTPVYEKDSSNDENTTPVYEKDSSTIVYRADAVAVPIDSSAVEPTTPSSARVSNIFTYNVNRRSAAATEGEVFITPLTVQTQSKDTTPVISSTVFPGHTQEEDARTSTMQQSLSMSYSEAFDGLSNEEAQAMVSRLTTRLSKPIEERLAFDLLRLARHKMLGAGNGRGRSRGAKDGVASSRLPTAVLAAARHARLNTSISLDRKGMENILENTLASQRTEPAQSLSKYLPALAVPLDPTPGILSVHTVPANGTGAGESGAAGDGEIDKEVALFLGVIDWLQPYNARKRLEYSFKSVFIRGSHAISVCEPRVYAKRFLNLMSRLFVVEKE